MSWFKFRDPNLCRRKEAENTEHAGGTSFPFSFHSLCGWRLRTKKNFCPGSKISPLQLGTDKLQVQKLLEGRGRHLPKFCIARFDHFYRLEITEWSPLPASLSALALWSCAGIMREACHPLLLGSPLIRRVILGTEEEILALFMIEYLVENLFFYIFYFFVK